MASAQAVQYRRFYLSDSFISQFKDKQPNWGPLGYITYKRTYSRVKEDGTKEEYWETLKRVVEGVFNIQKQHVLSNGLHWDNARSQKTAQEMYHAMWEFKFLPPGRGLWAMGSDYVEERSAAALFNCAAVSTENINERGAEIFAFIMDALMLGVGVGFDTKGAEKIKIMQPSKSNGIFVIDDSREGWVESVRLLINSFFTGLPLPKFDYSKIRSEGEPIRGFGGTSSGYKPLKELHEAIVEHLSDRDGEFITSTDIVDLENYISRCVIAGNVRRGAALALGDSNDTEFMELKHDQDKLYSHRYGSNNSISCDIGMDYSIAVNNLLKQGEPGFQWLENARKYGRTQDEVSDPFVCMTNPCVTGNTIVYTADGRGNVPIKLLAEEGKDVPVFCYDDNRKIVIRYMRNPRITGFEDIYKITLDDGSFVEVTGNHKILTHKRSYVEAKDLRKGDSLKTLTKYEASIKDVFYDANSRSQNYFWLASGFKGVKSEHRLIAEFHNSSPIPKGYVVHHKDRDALNNNPNNLEIMSKKDHDELHGKLMTGDNNPMRRAKYEWSEEKWKTYRSNISKATSGKANGRYLGVTNDELKEHAIILTKKLKRRFSTGDWREYARDNGLPIDFSKWRKDHLGGILGLAKFAALSCGYDEFLESDPRTIRSYKQWTSEGYNCEITGKGTIIVKSCEDCGKRLELNYRRREQSICKKCSTIRTNSNSAHIQKRKNSSSKTYENKRKIFREQQLDIFTALKFDLERTPLKEEWAAACKEMEITAEIGRKGSPFKSWRALKEEAELYNHRVVSVERTGKQTVYNGTVDEFHNFFVGGFEGETKNKKRKWLYLNNLNCGEIFLESEELCNLCELFPAHHKSLEEFKRTIKLAYLYAKTVTLTKTHWPRTNATMLKNRRIGLSQSGIIQAFNRHGVREVLNWCDESYIYVRELDEKYSNWLCIPKSIKVTTVKPSGTVSLLCGATPGIHYPEAEYYIRRIRFSKNSELIPFIKKAGYHIEEDAYAGETTLVVSIPVKEKYFIKSKQDVSMWEQLENTAKYQFYWADNAVSNTISVKPQEYSSIVPALELYEDKLKSVSFLPLNEHGYKQAPYEAITEEEYEAMIKDLSEIDFSQVNAEAEGVKYCDGESCEVVPSGA